MPNRANIKFFLRKLDDDKTAAWLLLSESNNRAHAGNDGYADEVDHLYQWDSTVPNHASVSNGDIAVLWDKQKLLGISSIERIASDLETKYRYRCPSCTSTKIKKRTSKIPIYKCGDPICREEFDIAAIEEIGVTTYRAEYGKLWTPLTGELDAENCRKLADKQKSQHSMRKINIGRLRLFLLTF